MEKELEIDWNGGKEKIVIKAWSYPQKLKAISEATKVKYRSGEQEADFDSYKFLMRQLMTCVKTAPFAFDRLDIEKAAKDLDEVPLPVLEFVSSEVQRVNDFSEGQKKA